MSAVESVLGNPILENLRRRVKTDLVNAFPELSSCEHKNFMALAKFLKSTPHRFFSRSVYNEYSKWLESRDEVDRAGLQSYLETHDNELDQALSQLEDVCIQDWHDSNVRLGGYEAFRFIDQRVHPTYLRLVEAVFCPFARLIAHFSRLDRGKKAEGLDLWSVVEELRGRFSDDALRPYHHLVRNGIAHGGIVYLANAIQYTDKVGNVTEIPESEVIFMCDDLLDVCAGIALALSIFFLTRQPVGYALPKQLLLEELRTETQCPWWEITGYVSQSTTGRQLIVYAQQSTIDSKKAWLSAFQTGVLAEQFSPGFDRYFLSISSDELGAGFVAFDGQKLREFRHTTRTLEEYGNSIESILLPKAPWYKFPALLGRFETISAAFRINASIAIADYWDQLGQTNFCVRSSQIHRNSWGCVLKGYVVLLCPTNHISQDSIRAICGRVVRRALRHARKDISRFNILRYLPLGFGLISVYGEDHRTRRLQTYGLGAGLICTIRLHRISRIKIPDILGSTIERYGKFRIAWNRAWLNSINNR